MIAGLMLFLAYILPLPIAAACFYFHLFEHAPDLFTRLIYIAGVSLAPSAILLLLALKRIFHFIFILLCATAAIYGVQHFVPRH